MQSVVSRKLINFISKDKKIVLAKFDCGIWGLDPKVRVGMDLHEQRSQSALGRDEMLLQKQCRPTWDGSLSADVPQTASFLKSVNWQRPKDNLCSRRILREVIHVSVSSGYFLSHQIRFQSMTLWFSPDCFALLLLLCLTCHDLGSFKFASMRYSYLSDLSKDTH